MQGRQNRVCRGTIPSQIWAKKISKITSFKKPWIIPCHHVFSDFPRPWTGYFRGSIKWCAHLIAIYSDGPKYWRNRQPVSATIIALANPRCKIISSQGGSPSWYIWFTGFKMQARLHQLSRVYWKVLQIYLCYFLGLNIPKNAVLL